MREDGVHGSWPSDQLSLQWEHGNWGCFVCPFFSVVLLSLLSLSLIKSSCLTMLDVHSGGPGEKGK
jgi:hypothetical protein